MKRLLVLKMLLFMLLLFAALPLFAQGTQDDTVWTHDFNSPEEVNCVKFSPNGNYIAACIYSTIYLLDTETGEVVREFIGHKKPIYSIAFSLTGDTLFSCGEDNFIVLWNVKTGDSLLMITQNLQIHQLALSPNSKYLVFSSINNNGYENPNYLNLWNIEEKKMIKSVDMQGQVEKISYDPSGKYLGIPTDHRYGFSKPPYNAVRLYDADNLSEISLFGWHDYEIYDLAFSPDGTMLATASMDHTCKIWSVEEKKLLTSFNFTIWPEAIDFSPDSKKIFIGNSDKANSSIFDINHESKIYTYQTGGMVHSLDVTKNEKHIVAGIYNKVTLYNAKWTGTYVEEIEKKSEEIIYPNPSDNTFNIEFILPEPNNTIINIFDSQGILIENVLNDYLETGFHSILWNPKLISSGTYYCKIQSGSYSKTFKLILNK